MRIANDIHGNRLVDHGMGFVPVAPPPALGNCFTGSCQQALSPYGYQACGPVAQVAQVIAQAPPAAPLAGDAGLGNCFTGSCANALAPYGWSSPPCGMAPVETMAWSIAQRIVSRKHGIFAR